MQPFVDFLYQSAPSRQHMERADRAALDGACAPGHLVMDILCAKHGTLLLGPLRALESLRQFPLASLQDSVIFSLHSKCPFMRKVKVCKSALYHAQKGISSLLGQSQPQKHAWVGPRSLSENSHWVVYI